MSDPYFRWVSNEPFVCVVCQREIECRWNLLGKGQEMPPICRYCEGWHTMRVGKPRDGAFRDRRDALRVMALADALHCEAARIKWSAHHAA